MPVPPPSFVPPVDVDEFIHCCELVARPSIRDSPERAHPVFFIEDPVSVRMLAVRERCGDDDARFMAVTARFLALMELHRELRAAGYLREVQGGVELDRAVIQVAAVHPIDRETRLQFDTSSFLERVAELAAPRSH